MPFLFILPPIFRHIYSHFETIVDQSKITEAGKPVLKFTEFFFPDLRLLTDINFTDFIFTYNYSVYRRGGGG